MEEDKEVCGQPIGHGVYPPAFKSVSPRINNAPLGMETATSNQFHGPPALFLNRLV